MKEVFLYVCVCVHNSIFEAFSPLIQKLIVSELAETNESSSVCVHCTFIYMFPKHPKKRERRAKRFFAFARKEKYKQAQYANAA